MVTAKVLRAMKSIVTGLAVLGGTCSGSVASAEILDFYTVRGDQLIENEPFFNNQVQQVADIIDALNLGAPQVNVVVRPILDGASFDYGSIVEMPRTLEFQGHLGGVYTKTIADQLAVFAHEYAHALFGNMLAEQFSDYAELKRVKLQASELTLQLLRGGLGDAEKERLQNQIEQLHDSVNANKDLIKISRQVAPYSELYADAVAVFVMNSKMAIYEALTFRELHPDHGFGARPGFGMGMPMDKAEPHKEARDFGLFHDPERWSFSDEHAMFGPLRSKLGSSGCWPQTQQQKTERLQQLQIVLIRHLQQKVSSGEMPGPEDNKHLIAEMGAYCQ